MTPSIGPATAITELTTVWQQRHRARIEPLHHHHLLSKHCSEDTKVVDQSTPRRRSIHQITFIFTSASSFHRCLYIIKESLISLTFESSNIETMKFNGENLLRFHVQDKVFQKTQ